MNFNARVDGVLFTSKGRKLLGGFYDAAGDERNCTEASLGDVACVH